MRYHYYSRQAESQRKMTGAAIEERPGVSPYSSASKGEGAEKAASNRKGMGQNKTKKEYWPDDW